MPNKCIEKSELRKAEISSLNCVAVVVGELHTRINLADFPHTEKIGEKKENGYDIEFYSVPDAVSTPVYDAASNSTKLAPVTGWSIHKGKEVEIVRLANGSTIITDNDPRAVFGIARDAESLVPERFTPSEALRRGVCVPVIAGTGGIRRQVSWDCGPEVLECEGTESISDYGVMASSTRFQAEFDFTTGRIVGGEEAWDDLGGPDDAIEVRHHITADMDFEFGQFLGCMCGDGWWDKKDCDFAPGLILSPRKLYMSDLEGCNAKFCEDYLNKVLDGGVKTDRKDYRKAEYEDTSRYTYIHPRMKEMAVTLTELLGGERDESAAGSGNKKLPPWINVAPYDCKMGVLCGLIATDGSIAINRHKGRKRKEQLNINLSSTSLTLLSDVHSMLLSMDITSGISFSKVTSAGNYHWVLSIGTGGIKRAEKDMAGMCHRRKYEVLRSACVTEEKSSYRGSHIVFPKCVSDVVSKWVYCPKITKEMRSDTTGKYADLIKQNDFFILIRSSAVKGYVTENLLARIVDYAGQILHDGHGAMCTARAVLLDNIAAAYSRGVMDYSTELDYKLREALSEAFHKHDEGVTRIVRDLVSKVRRKMDKAVKTGKLPVAVAVEIRAIISEAEPCIRLWDESIFVEWVDMAYGGFNWTQVKEVEKTGRVETGYDLTVPGYETFLSADGVVLSNTINVHAPATDESAQEIKEKLLPSINPFSAREADKIVPLPKQEQIWGLYTAMQRPSKQTHTFGTEAEALQAIKQGKVSPSDEVEITGMEKMAAGATIKVEEPVAYEGPPRTTAGQFTSPVHKKEEEKEEEDESK